MVATNEVPSMEKLTQELSAGIQNI